MTQLLPELPRTGRVTLALAGTLLDPVVVFAKVTPPDGSPITPVDWLPVGGARGVPGARDELVAWLRRARDEPVTLIGHSSGGFLALLTTIAAPDVVSDVMTINTGANTRNHGDPSAPDRFVDGITSAVLDPFIDRCFTSPPDPSTRARLEEYAHRADPGDVVAAMRTQRALSVSDHLASISAPVIALHGVRDRVRTPEHAVEIADGVQRGKLVPVDCGHTAPIEAPAAVSAAIELLWSAPSNERVDWSTTSGA